MPSLCESVRRHCAEVAGSARWIRLDADAFREPERVAGLDPALHFLSAPAEEVARYVLVLDAINFGSGWFDTLALEPGESGTTTITRRLTRHAIEHDGTWTVAELGRLDAAAVAEVLGQDPGHELMRLYAAALRELAGWLGDGPVLETIGRAGGSADRFARMLADGMPFFDDPGFYKRAQITANDVALAGVAQFGDVDRLTAFADNLVPHVLRLDGVLVYDDELAAIVDAGEELPKDSPMEREIRACAVHACELAARRVGVPPRVLDNWIWNRGERAPASKQRAHRTRTVFY